MKNTTVLLFLMHSNRCASQVAGKSVRVEGELVETGREERRWASDRNISLGPVIIIPHR